MYLNEVDHFYDCVRPRLTDSQSQLLRAFYSARSYKKADESLTKQEVKEAASQIIYDRDLAEYVIKSCDDYRLGLVIERIKRQQK